ncbi:hypothetical protein E2562_037134 [Oryza meyeriana var. granulata]|uniref:HMA domain-containing protein n=1 Tax=Oryza meyeriana var. granulata TaxID=110450 RepID=A0A6G1F268_9ORYZ|nr:hypothetical protein E2562_037134 [Oryza meyeriana var. granulata]
MAPVLLQMEVHCHGCAKKIEKAIKKIPGVTAVKAYVGEGQAGQVVVQGIAGAEVVKARLEAKLKKPVVIVSTGNEPPPTAPAAADPQAPPSPLPQTTGSSSAPINPPPAAQPQHAAPPAAQPQPAAPPAPPPQYAAAPAPPPQYAARPAPPQYGGQQAPPQYGAPPPQDYYYQAGANPYPLRYPPSYFSDDNPNGCSDCDAMQLSCDNTVSHGRDVTVQWCRCSSVRHRR